MLFDSAGTGADQISKVKLKMGRQRIKRWSSSSSRQRTVNPLEVLSHLPLLSTGNDIEESEGVNSGDMKTEVKVATRSEEAIQYLNSEQSDNTNELSNSGRRRKWRSHERSSFPTSRRQRRRRTSGSGAFLVDVANNEAAPFKGNDDEVETRKSDGGRESAQQQRTKRESGGGASANCRNKNVWIENFVYSPEFTVKWRFDESDLQQINQTNMVISFR